jgi:hypothetical protein
MQEWETSRQNPLVAHKLNTGGDVGPDKDGNKKAQKA